MISMFAKKNFNNSPSPSPITVAQMDEIEEEEPDFQREPSPKFKQEYVRRFNVTPQPKLTNIMEEKENEFDFNQNTCNEIVDTSQVQFVDFISDQPVPSTPKKTEQLIHRKQPHQAITLADSNSKLLLSNSGIKEEPTPPNDNKISEESADEMFKESESMDFKVEVAKNKTAESEDEEVPPIRRSPNKRAGSPCQI